MLNFLRNAMVGGLYLGLSRAEVVRMLGRPQNWLGKPPTYGLGFDEPEKSDVWIYRALNIHFAPLETVASLSVSISHFEREDPLFAGWPDVKGWGLNVLSAWAKKNSIKIRDLEFATYPLWCVGKRCKVFPVISNKNSRRWPVEECPIYSLQVYENFSDLEFDVRFGQLRRTTPELRC